jgi:hypothetical protein
MNCRRIIAIVVSCFLAPQVSAASIEDFYWIWVEKDQAPFDCAEAEGEGPWITIGRNLYTQENADPCNDIEMFMTKGGKLRVSASCAGDEEGFTSVNAEFELKGNGEMVRGVNGFYDTPMTYVKCSGRLPQWFHEAR